MKQMNIFKNRRMLYAFLAMIFIIPFTGVIMITAPAGATAGTTGAFAGDNPTTVLQSNWVTIAFTNLNPSSDYIVTLTNLNNITFSTGSGTTSGQITFAAETTGSVTMVLYGYNLSTGYNSGAAIASALLTVTPATDFSGNQVLNYLPYFFVIVLILVGAGVFAKSKYG